jgi:LEA14-like dessication related protein
MKIVICIGLALLVALSCSATKKMQAASILKKCKFSFQKFEVDSFKGDSLKFNVILNAYNEGKDSLFVHNLAGTVYIDDIFEIPVTLQKSKWISPGNSQVAFSGAVQLDLFKLLSLPQAEKFRMRGKAYIALKPEQSSTEIEFDETKDIPPDWLEKQIKSLLGIK